MTDAVEPGRIEMMLESRVAVVTGATRGLGEGITRAFAAEGATVAMFGRDLGRLRQHEQELAGAGSTAVPHQVDVSSSAAVAAAVDATLNRFGRIDILVNTAGIAPSVPLVEMTDRDRDEVFAININGSFNCARAVLPSMIDAAYGKIINLSSVTGPLVSGKGLTAYAASKGAISGFTRTLALEVAEHGINVNAILPGSFDTPMMRDIARLRSDDEDGYLRALGSGMPMGRLGSSEEVGDLAVFLASERSRYITGAEIVIDGGNVICEH